jgi:hypothetical protein
LSRFRNSVRISDSVSRTCVVESTESPWLPMLATSLLSGWLRYQINLMDERGMCSVAFDLRGGDAVFNTINARNWQGYRSTSSNSFEYSRPGERDCRVMSHKNWSPARRSTRISTDLPVEIHGDGFACVGKAVTVNLHGALIRIAPSSRALKVGDRISLYVHRTCKCALGTVVFANHSRSEFGIALENPANIWGALVSPTLMYSRKRGGSRSDRCMRS